VSNLVPPILFTEYTQAKYDWANGCSLSDEQIDAVLGVGSYYGSLLRITYLQYVHRKDLEPCAYWDAVIAVFMLGGIWFSAFEELLKDKQVNKKLKRFQRPEWVKVGLIGCDWKVLKGMCEEFCAEMDAVDKSA